MKEFLSAVLSFKPTYRMWSFLFMTIIVELILITGTFMNWHLRQIPGLVEFTFISFLASFISHLSVTKQPKRLITLVIYFGLTGFLVDAVLINLDQFQFNIERFSLFKTPLAQLLTWFFMCYAVFSTSSALGILLQKGKINYPLIGVFLLAFFDGFLLMGYSFLMEPVGVNEGTWTWLVDIPHKYYNIPFIVFFGYFIAMFLLSLPFRLFESMRPVQERHLPFHVIIFSPIIFILLMILLILNLIKLNLIVVTVIGGFITACFLLIFLITAYTYLEAQKQENQISIISNDIK